MYDDQTRVGRFGVEVQMALLVHPEALEFDADAKKLGSALSPPAREHLTAPPARWSWTADPTLSTSYVTGGDEISEERRDWFLYDTDTQFAGTVGHDTYWVWSDGRPVGFQLELVSDPLDGAYGRAEFRRDARVLYRDGLAEMLELGLVRAYRPERQQAIKEQLSVEIHDETWDASNDGLERLSWLALGLYVLTRFRSMLAVRDPHVERLLEVLDDDISGNARRLGHYDLFTNYRLLMDGYFFGAVEELDLTRLRTFVDGRAHTAVLATAFDNDRCHFYVHGVASLTGEDLAELSADDFALLRRLGIDSLFLDMYVGERQPHLDSSARLRRPELLRRGIERLVDIEPIHDALSTAIAGGTPSVGSVSIPMCHPRKTIAPGVVYIEFRHVNHIRGNDDPRYPARYMTVPSPDGPLRVVHIDHLHTLATDWCELLDVASIVGRSVVESIRTGRDGIAERDFDRFFDRYGPMADYVLRSYRRPPWHHPQAPDVEVTG